MVLRYDRRYTFIVNVLYKIYFKKQETKRKTVALFKSLSVFFASTYMQWEWAASYCNISIDHTKQSHFIKNSTIFNRTVMSLDVKCILKLNLLQLS